MGRKISSIQGIIKRIEEFRLLNESVRFNDGDIFISKRDWEQLKQEVKEVSKWKIKTKQKKWIII